VSDDIVRNDISRLSTFLGVKHVAEQENITSGVTTPSPTWRTRKTGKQRSSLAPCTVPPSQLRIDILTDPSTLHIPFPSPHLAQTAQRALSVDAELSPLVRRAFSLTTSSESQEQSTLQVNYAATTNRMLRVAVNGFIESIGVVIGVMKELDTDVVYEPTKEGLEGVQGLDVEKVG
jgi:EKC/KEOPS complex subunit PCC1/LAGE3